MFLVQRMISIYLIICAIFLASNVIARRNHQHGRKYSSYPDYDDYEHKMISQKIDKKKAKSNLSLWIDEEQVKILSGFSMKIYAIHKGRVSMHLTSRNVNNNLPIIPSEVSCVNFTWRSGKRKYLYDFDRLQSLDETILKPPSVSIPTEGEVPQQAEEFSVHLPCVDNSSGIATFSIGLLISTKRGKPIPGTPLRLHLRKECVQRGVYDRASLSTSMQAPDPECSKKCANGGWCNQEKICQCPVGYMGQYCQTALCYPQCMNGGFCTAPQKCQCPTGYQGRHCEGGICEPKCLNGGKCIQKDKCQCTKGFYGPQCQFSKCVIPCMNGGKCDGVNKCRCSEGFDGNHCEIEIGQQFHMQMMGQCRKPCRHGVCMSDNRCNCNKGWFGRFCNQHGNRRNRHGQHHRPHGLNAKIYN